MSRITTCLLYLTFCFVVSVARADEPAEKSPGKNPPKIWQALKDNWVSCDFGGDGESKVKGNAISLAAGSPLSGVRWTGEAPLENYEIELEARRTDGFDFFCGLTFPVADKHVTFVLGGWGGGVVGISNIDGLDASENEQTFYRTFENDKWYKVRVQVDPSQITCWIDDKSVIGQPRADHRFDVRFEMEACFPIGLAAYACDAEYRNVNIRKLTEAEIAAAKKAAEERAAEDE